MAESKTIQEQYQELAKTGKKVKVKFLKSPTGLLNLAYSAGQEASFPKAKADFLIELGLAEPVKAAKKTKPATPPAPEAEQEPEAEEPEADSETE